MSGKFNVDIALYPSDVCSHSHCILIWGKDAKNRRDDKAISEEIAACPEKNGTTDPCFMMLFCSFPQKNSKMLSRIDIFLRI